MKSALGLLGLVLTLLLIGALAKTALRRLTQIGRASCRERV